MTFMLKSLASILLASTLVLGCDDTANNQDVQSVAPPPIPASDVDFIDSLVPHHRMAVEMADEESTLR